MLALMVQEYCQVWGGQVLGIVGGQHSNLGMVDGVFRCRQSVI